MSGPRHRPDIDDPVAAPDRRAQPRAPNMKPERVTRRSRAPRRSPPLDRAPAGPRRRKFVWILYAGRVHLNGDPERRARMFDLLYLAAGLGFFASMGAYARWAGRA